MIDWFLVGFWEWGGFLLFVLVSGLWWFFVGGVGLLRFVLLFFVGVLCL